MNKRLIWVDGDEFSGWCCSRCTWGMTAPRLESTVAALAFNRLAQEDFENHSCNPKPTLSSTVGHASVHPVVIKDTSSQQS